MNYLVDEALGIDDLPKQSLTYNQAFIELIRLARTSGTFQVGDPWEYIIEMMKPGDTMDSIQRRRDVVEFLIISLLENNSADTVEEILLIFYADLIPKLKAYFDYEAGRSTFTIFFSIMRPI